MIVKQVVKIEELQIGVEYEVEHIERDIFKGIYLGLTDSSTFLVFKQADVKLKSMINPDKLIAIYKYNDSLGAKQMTFIPERTQHNLYARLPQLPLNNEYPRLNDPRFHIGEIVYVKDSQTDPENWKEKIVIGIKIFWSTGIDPTDKTEYHLQKPSWDYLLGDELSTFDVDQNSYWLEHDLVNTVEYYKLIDSYPEKSFLE